MTFDLDDKFIISGKEWRIAEIFRKNGHKDFTLSHETIDGRYESVHYSDEKLEELLKNHEIHFPYQE